MSVSLPDRIKKHDSKGMLDLILSFYSQVESAIEIGRAAELPEPRNEIRKVYVAGMGGSAIGGNILQDLLQAGGNVDCGVVRDYELPAQADESSLVVLCSYSGDTEETISAYHSARRNGCLCYVCTSGGKLLDFARQDSLPHIVIPGGQPPRSALGYLFFPMLMSFMQWGWITPSLVDLDELINLLKSISYQNDPARNEDPAAAQIARQHKNKIPILYSSRNLETVAMRWKAQICENSKSLAYQNLIPEMNHNEIIGWQRSEQMELSERLAVIFLRDSDDHERVRTRIDVVKDIIRQTTSHILEVESQGNALLTRLFSLIYLGDLFSFYLAMYNEEDPTPIRNIDYLKSELAGSPSAPRTT